MTAMDRSITGRGRQLLYRSIRRLPLYPSYGRYCITTCDDPAFLWFRVAKVATRSIFAQLRSNGLEFEERWNLRYPVNRFDEHLAFAFVRNPWDRLVSCWINRVVHTNKYEFDADTLARMQHLPEFVKFVSSFDLDHTHDDHLRTQSSLVDLNRVDFVGRFETFTDDLRAVFDRLGLECDPGIHDNRSDRRADYRSYYDDASARRVRSLYGKDVEIFGYAFG